MRNAYAQIPPECYVKTRTADGSVKNSCAVCHHAADEPNFVEDAALQLAYTLPASARKNPYENLLVERSDALAISDERVLAHARGDNYRSPDGALILAARFGRPTSSGTLATPSPRGYLPDAYFDFDERGFDRDDEGKPTGWRAFSYAPLKGAFGPDFGSFGDVLVRLPPAFRENASGAYDEDAYVVNLAVVEAMLRRKDIAIEATDERRYGVDLDGDGALATARSVRFRFGGAPVDGLRYVGRASGLDESGGRMAPGLYPIGTEFLHSLRYLDVTPEGVRPARRMKELRYARKAQFLSYAALRSQATHEMREKEQAPDRPRRLFGDPVRGVSNGQGWVYQGFIEDERGELRRQSAEEHLACVGCHGGIGATTDSSFAMPRKLERSARRRDWAHQLDLDLSKLPEPVALPTRERALLLDKLYFSIVKAQSFSFGRGPVTASPEELWTTVPADEPTGVELPLSPVDQTL
jgi:hypothetical protein